MPVRFFLAVRGASPELPAATIRCAVTDYDRQSVTQGTFTVGLRDGQGRTTLELPALPAGYYELAIEAQGEGLSAFRGRQSFGVLDVLDFAVPADSPISLDAGLSWGCDEPTRAATAAAACARIGLRMLRERLSWSQVHPEPGRFDWGRYAPTARIQRAAGLDVYPVFHDCPPWAAFPSADEKPVHSAAPDDPRATYEFTRQLTLDLGSAVRFLELWNEPEIFFFTGHPWDLAAVIKAGYLGVKGTDPTLGVLNASRCAGPEFWRLLLANGVGGYFDIWNRHSYEAPERLFAIADEDRTVMAEAGLERPIWMTEMGLRAMPSKDGRYETGERVQVSYLLRAYACALAAGIERFMYFYLQEFLEYGVHLWGLTRADLSPKPAWIALATLVRQLGRARVVGFLQEGERYCIVFERGDDDHVGLAWSLEGSPIRYGWGVALPELGADWSAAEGAFELPVKEGAFLVNPVGRRLNELAGPTATVRLAVEPVFIRGLDVSRMDLTPPRPMPRYSPSPEPVPAEQAVWLQVVPRPGEPRRQEQVHAQKLALWTAPGQAEPVEFRIHNWTAAPASVELQVAPPTEWSADGPLTTTLTVAAGAAERVITTFTAPAAAQPDTLCSLQARLILQGRPRDQARIDYTIKVQQLGH